MIPRRITPWRAAWQAKARLAQERWRHCCLLQAGARIALIGRFARSPRYQGAGSSLMNPSRLDNLHDELVKLVGEANLTYAPGYTEKGDAADETLIQEALDAASKADVVVICAGLTDMYEVEGIDRKHMRLPAGHDCAHPAPGCRSQKGGGGVEQRLAGRNALGGDCPRHPGRLSRRAGRRRRPGGHPDRQGQPQRQAG